MALKVAIMGLSQSSRHLAPWNKPDWQLWGLAWDHDRFKYERTFEMHEMRELRQYQTKAYLRDLHHCPALHMHDAYPEVAGSIRYPFEAVAGLVGDYWNSSIGYAMALAIHEGAQEIGLYGIDMRAADEYGYQRPNIEYLIGFARGRGIKVHIPDVSPLCKFQDVPGCDYDGRYGRLK